MANHTGSSKLLFEEARKAESSGDEKKAVTIYKRMVRSNPLDTNALQRLMIVYRKLKDFTAELQTIKTAINNLRDRLVEEQQEWIRKNPKVAGVAKSLGKSLGFLDSKGRPVHNEPLLERWMKRKDLVEEKIRKLKQR